MSIPEMAAAEKPVLLLVDNRPSDFTRYVLERPDVTVVLLRFDAFGDTVPNWPPWGRLPDWYRKETAHIPAFDVHPDRPLEEEAERYLAWAAGLPSEPRFFCNPEEHLQEIAHRFAGLVGLPHLSEQQVLWVRDKVAMKDKFVELGVPCARYGRVETWEDVREFGREHGWPLVLKPVDSFATIDTYRLDGPEDLDRIAPSLPARTWMVEEFVAGDEYQLCALVVGGRVLDTFLSVNPSPLLEAVSGSMNADVTVGPACPQDRLRNNVRGLVQRLVDGMALEFGYLHMEFFVSPDESIRMSEIAARIAGCGIPANHGLAFGFDIFGATLDAYLGRAMKLIYSESRCVGDLLLPARAGLVVDITPLADLLRLPGVLCGQLEIAVGDIVPDRRASNARSGIVHVAGESVEEVLDRMRSVLDKFELQIARTPPAPSRKDGGTVGRFELEVETSMSRVDRAEWDRLEGKRSFYQSHPWLSWAEADAHCAPVYLMVRAASGSLVGAVAAYLATGANGSWDSWYDPLHVLTGGAEQTEFRRPNWSPLLLVGSRAGYHSDVLLDQSLGGEHRQAVLGALIAGCRALATSRQAASMAMMYTPAGTTRAIHHAAVGAEHVVPLSANTRINAQWRNLDAFLGSFPRRRRYNIQREIDVFQSGGTEVVEARLSECVDQVGPLLGNVHRRHGAGDTDADTTLYLKSQMEHMDDCSKVFLELAGGEPVGFSLCYEWGRQLHARVVGFDYERSARFAYFNLAYYLPLQYAITRGLEAVHLGPGTYEAKVNRGATLDPTWAVVWPPGGEESRWFRAVTRAGEDAQEASRWTKHVLWPAAPKDDGEPHGEMATSTSESISTAVVRVGVSAPA